MVRDRGLIRRFSGPGRAAVRWAAQPGLLAMASTWPKSISAMVRVRNEEEWLYQAVSSVANLVDELILVDNASSDRTPQLIRQIAAEHPAKTRTFPYPHLIARQGAENADLVAHDDGRSPRLLANYYNWCLDRCSNPYVFKWDGDEIATDEMQRALSAFRRSRKHVLMLFGRNVHPSLTSVIRDVPPVVDAPSGFWGSVPSTQDPEPRVFPRRFARYWSNRLWESLASPYLRHALTLRWERPTYLHMAMCKGEPFANASPNDRQARLRSSLQPGAALTASEAAALERGRSVVVVR